MSEPMLPYDQWIDGALRGVIRRALAEVAAHGLPGDHHFYITFKTTAEGVELAASVRAMHPEQMTIVLQHQFRGLAVDDDGFSVTLKFGGRSQRLRVPFASVIAFADPSVNFGLQFKLTVVSGQEHAGQEQAGGEPPADAATQAAEEGADDADAADEGSARVIALDTFRKK